MGPSLILPAVNVPSFANYENDVSGIDCLQRCSDKQYWLDYPYRVIYHYNSRGFRDQEWTWNSATLKQSLWCVGDSFTAGIGQPWEHTWPRVLAKQINHEVRNVSLDGGSNEWIARMCEQLVQDISPIGIVVMWTYIHRRDSIDPQSQAATYGINRETIEQQWVDYYRAVQDPSWPPCPPLATFSVLPTTVKQYIRDHHALEWLEITQELEAHIRDDARTRMHHVRSTEKQDLDNFRDCVDRVSALPCRIIHATIPRFSPRHLLHQARSILESYGETVPYFEHLDWARDRVHFDIKTSQWIACQLETLLADLAQTT